MKEISKERLTIEGRLIQRMSTGSKFSKVIYIRIINALLVFRLGNQRRGLCTLSSNNCTNYIGDFTWKRVSKNRVNSGKLPMPKVMDNPELRGLLVISKCNDYLEREYTRS